MQYYVNNGFNPMLSLPTYPESEAVKTALTMVQKGVLDAKIKKLPDREKHSGREPKKGVYNPSRTVH